MLFSVFQPHMRSCDFLRIPCLKSPQWQKPRLHSVLNDLALDENMTNDLPHP